MLAPKAIVNQPVLVYSNSAIDSRHNISMAVLAYSFFK